MKGTSVSKRMGSRARKARKAAIEARAALIVEGPKPVAFVTPTGRKGTVGFAKASPMHHSAIQGRTYHATAWNAPTGEGRAKASVGLIPRKSRGVGEAQALVASAKSDKGFQALQARAEAAYIAERAKKEARKRK